MNSKTLTRKRETGELPYKVPATDGRRARHALPTVSVPSADYELIRVGMSVAVKEVLRMFRIKRPSK